MNRYIKISAALAAFALLLVVMGLSTQPTVHAAPGDITVDPKYVCSLPTSGCDRTPRITVGNHDPNEEPCQRAARASSRSPTLTWRRSG